MGPLAEPCPEASGRMLPGRRAATAQDAGTVRLSRTRRPFARGSPRAAVSLSPSHGRLAAAHGCRRVTYREVLQPSGHVGSACGRR